MATVDRITVTVPKELSARLKVVRDRMNVSKVCADALERELNMLEAKPSVADPKIAQLVERLKGSKQRWYDHGHDDAMQWAVDNIKREELKGVAEGALGPLPGFGMDTFTRINKWVARDLGMEDVPIMPMDTPRDYIRAATGRPPLDSTPEQQAAKVASAQYAKAKNENVDEPAYMEGWRDALVELWDAVAPALR